MVFLANPSEDKDELFPDADSTSIDSKDTPQQPACSEDPFPRPLYKDAKGIENEAEINRIFFENVKLNAVYNVACQLIYGLNILRDREDCTKKFVKHVGLSFKVFRWGLHDFDNRSEDTRFFLGLMKTKIPAECLESKKLQVDIDEIIKFVVAITESITARKGSRLLDAMEELHAAEYYMQMEADLRKEVKENAAKSTEALYKYVSANLLRDNRYQKHRIMVKIMDQTTTEPIRLRYQIGWSRAIEEQEAIRWQQKAKKCLDQMDEYTLKSNIELVAIESIVNMYVMDIEELQGQIDDLTIKYERRFEELDSRIRRNELLIETMRIQRMFCEAQMEAWAEEQVTYDMNPLTSLVHKRDLERIRDFFATREPSVDDFSSGKTRLSRRSSRGSTLHRVSTGIVSANKETEATKTETNKTETNKTETNETETNETETNETETKKRRITFENLPKREKNSKTRKI